MNLALLDTLGISEGLLQQRGFIAQQEAATLVLAETGEDGRQYLLTPAACAAWHAMKQAAAADGVALLMISAFRSVERQAEIIRDKLGRQMPIEHILQVCAPPGYSEHHTGRAIDIATPDDPDLEESFELTPAFAWLNEHASAFGFHLSYPRGNLSGYLYEPWHWCHQPDTAG